MLACLNGGNNSNEAHETNTNKPFGHDSLSALRGSGQVDRQPPFKQNARWLSRPPCCKLEHNPFSSGSNSARHVRGWLKSHCECKRPGLAPKAQESKHSAHCASAFHSLQAKGRLAKSRHPAQLWHLQQPEFDSSEAQSKLVPQASAKRCSVFSVAQDRPCPSTSLPSSELSPRLDGS